MLVRLDNSAKHLSRFQALFIHKFHADAQKLRERMFHNLVEFLSLLPGLEPVHPADRKQALQARVDRVRIVGSQQLEGNIDEVRPLLGEVVLEDLLEKRD